MPFTVRARNTKPTRKNNHAPTPLYHVESEGVPDRSEAERTKRSSETAARLETALRDLLGHAEREAERDMTFRAFALPAIAEAHDALAELG